MNRQRKNPWIAALVIGALAAAGATSAGAFGRRGGPPGVSRLEHRIEQLNLPADTRAKALAIVDAARADERTLRDELRAEHEELLAMVQSGTSDTAAIDAQVETVGALRTQQHKQFLHVLLQVAAVLPEDQRAQWLAPPRPGEHHNGERRSHGPR
jgi:Spy/CpxP family protein refolding chaperone